LSAVLLGYFSINTSIVTPVHSVTKLSVIARPPEHVSLGTFLEDSTTRFTASDLWCSNALRALDNVI
jgi:hypothetical protein